MDHRFTSGEDLRRAVEKRRIKGRWADAHGLVEQNDAVTVAQGFELGAGKGWQPVRELPAAELVACPEEPAAVQDERSRRFVETEVCVANCDSLTAALVLGDACVLNFANAETPGGRYRSGARAQEEDLCRLLPQLYPTLLKAADTGAYPIRPGTALLSRGLLAVRQPGSYGCCGRLGECSVITAAMPICDGCRPRGGWLSEQSQWAKTVTLRVRAVLHACVHSGLSHLVLGAFGCGAFGNPTGPVAAIFRQQLASAEFRGQFQRVVFAIIDPVGTGNLLPFQKEISQLISKSTHRKLVEKSSSVWMPSAEAKPAELVEA